MKRLIYTALILVAVSTRGDVTAKLALEPPTVQAGIPTSVLLTLTNDGVSAVTVPSYAVMSAERPDGTSFIVTDGLHHLFSVAPQPITIVPHGSAVIRWDPDGSLITPFFDDERLSVPGNYKLTMVLADGLREENAAGGTVNDWLRSGSHILKSESATLVITTPKGNDAEVCEAARKARPSAPADACPVKTLLLDSGLGEFWQQHRATVYASYFAGTYAAPLPDRIAAIEAAIERNPANPIIDWKRIHLAQLEQQAAGEAFARNDAAAGKAHAMRALSLYKSVSSQGRLPEARNRAAALYDGFDDLLTVMGRK